MHCLNLPQVNRRIERSNVSYFNRRAADEASSRFPSQKIIAHGHITSIVVRVDTLLDD